MEYLVPIPDVFRRMDTMMKEMQELQNSLFSDPFFATPKTIWKSNTALPKINVKETEKEYIIEAAVPGYTKEDINLYVTGKNLHIDSNKSEENVIADEDKGYVFKELSSKSFRRTIPFPKNISEENVIANLENGFLTIKIQKVDSKENIRRIKIH